MFLESISVVLIALTTLLLGVSMQFNGLSYHKHWYLFFIKYGIATVVIVALFLKMGVPVLKPYEDLHLLPVLLLILSFGVVFWFNKTYPISNKTRKKHPHSFFLDFNTKYVGAKMLDILFQDIIIIGFVLVIFSTYESLLVTIAIFGSVFFFAHFFLVFVQGKASIYHLVGSFIAAFAFPILILTVPGGGYYTYTLHFFGYVVARIATPFLMFCKKKFTC